jgi:mono/diheme cytochrome c family protein/DNA-binding beta-propeller fold protein YncE
VRAIHLLIPALPAFALLSSCSLYVGADPVPTGKPISGGTMLVARDGARAIVADPERDEIYVVDVARQRITHRIDLEPGDEPGRVIEDGAGRFHVALRSGGAVVTVSADGASIVDRQDVCAAPRGLAWQETGDLVHVACATGELVTVPAAGGAPTRTLHLDRDLRDIVVDGDDLLVSRFRAAELLRVGADGVVRSRQAPPVVADPLFDETQEPFEGVPAVAYRTIGLGDGRAVMIHQRASGAPLSTMPGGYAGGGCFDGPIAVTATIFDPASADVAASRRRPMAQLPVDAALSPDGSHLAIVLAGGRTVRVVSLSSLPMSSTSDPCGFPQDFEVEVGADAAWWGAPTSTAFTPDGRLVIQFDNVIAIRDLDRLSSDAITLPSPNHLDPGRRRFYQPTFAGLACASCHPEGRDDGLVWNFDTLGERRTQNISGNLERRAPYHWDGDMHDLSMLVDEVLINRMGGEPLSDEEKDGLRTFLFSLPPLPASLDQDDAAVARGKALFEDSSVGCVSCHSGALFTDNSMRDVGTGGTFKVPSLVGVAWRAPYLHTGCAATLRDRFGACGGGEAHGGADLLAPDQLDDLIAYLESL